MAHPVVTHRVQESGGPPAPPARPCAHATSEPRLLPLLLPIIILGGLAMLHVVSLARLSMLECESRRLERLVLEQAMRRGELMRERARLTNTGVLFDYAVTHGMVSPACVQPVKVGVLPAKRVYWALPGETANGSFPASGQVGLLDEAGGAGPRLQ